MKKIVGILAAAAVMATSVFAADISAGARLEGSLFNYDGASESVSAINIKGANNPWNAPATFSISSDKAGATWKFTDNVTVATGASINDDGDVTVDTKGHVLATSHYRVWFKPVDMLEVRVGNIDESMNTESIDWGGRVLNYDSFGYEAIVNVDAIRVALSLVTGEGSNLFNKAKDADATLGEINLKADYSADFGTISAMFDFTNTFKVIKLAAGYKNTFDALTVFADVGFTADTDAEVNALAIDADVVYAQDALNVQAYVKATMADISNIKKETMGVLALAKLSYALDAGTVYLYVKDANVLADDFAATIKPGFTGSVGIMNYEVAAQIDIADKVSFGVPVNFSVNF